MLVVNGFDGGVRGIAGPRDPSPERCAGCGEGIRDRFYLLAVDRRWHASCLTCCRCKAPLDSELTCFAREGHIYCKEDYYRLFSAKQCTRCHLSISPSELVMRARDLVYHLHCFTCATCNKPLTKGEYFGLKEDVIYCRNHYEMLLQYETDPWPRLKEETRGPRAGEVQSSCEFSSGQTPTLEHTPFHPNQRANGKAHKGRPRKQKNFFASALINPLRGGTPVVNADDLCSLASGTHSSPHQQSSTSSLVAAGSDSSTSSEHLSRPKRMRTSFKHHQLRTMKSYFSINHNPDAKDLKQLSQKTGLSKRVLQVWFQNARAKWRRNLLRQQSQGPEIAQDSKPLSELTSQPRFCDPHLLGSSMLDVQPTPITQEEQNIQTFTNLL